MASIKLAGKALKAYEAHMAARVALEDELEEMVGRLDTADELMFQQVAKLARVDISLCWVINADFHEEFGVVLLQEIPSDDESDPDEVFEVPDEPERPALMN
jgi:hypothetical protein